MTNVKYLGYDVRITYDDYDQYKVIVQELKELEDICKNLENCDDNFHIEYKKKYQLDDETFLYTKKESYTIDNPTIPKRELYLRKFNNIAKTIAASIDVKDEDILECYNILNILVKINNEKD